MPLYLRFILRLCVYPAEQPSLRLSQLLFIRSIYEIVISFEVVSRWISPIFLFFFSFFSENISRWFIYIKKKKKGERKRKEVGGQKNLFSRRVGSLISSIEASLLPPFHCGIRSSRFLYEPFPLFPKLTVETGSSLLIFIGAYLSAGQRRDLLE